MFGVEEITFSTFQSNVKSISQGKYNLEDIIDTIIGLLNVPRTGLLDETLLLKEAEKIQQLLYQKNLDGMKIVPFDDQLIQAANLYTMLNKVHTTSIENILQQFQIDGYYFKDNNTMRKILTIIKIVKYAIANQNKTRQFYEMLHGILET